MTKCKVVVRLKDKTLLKGKLNNFSPFYSFFQLELLNGDSAIVNIDKIKAIFFVKSFEGNKEYKYKYEDKLFWVGDKITPKSAIDSMSFS
jgi:small nuclear ribonucleoprotein (snRNP)-like protein